MRPALGVIEVLLMQPGACASAGMQCLTCPRCLHLPACLLTHRPTVSVALALLAPAMAFLQR